MQALRKAHEHTYNKKRGGERMADKYDATYYPVKCKAIVRIVAPPLMSDEEKEKRVEAMHHAAWKAWQSIPVEERLRINDDRSKCK